MLQQEETTMERITLRTQTCAAAHAWVALIAIWLVLGLAGCGGGKPDVPETAPVSGVVLYKGKPVDQAEVTFHPQAEGHPGVGRTDSEGRFLLTTYAQTDGAVLGKHVVTVQLMPENAVPGMEMQTPGITPIPAKYADPSKSPLSAEVKAGEDNEFKLELED